MKNISILVIKTDEYAYIDVLNYLKRKAQRIASQAFPFIFIELILIRNPHFISGL